ncbi:hypothetical protein H4R21_002032, partial [Coemansia helicoidea]
GSVGEYETHYLQQRSTELLLENDAAVARLLCRLEISGDRAATMASHLVSFLRGNPLTAANVEDFVTSTYDMHVVRYSAVAANHPRNVLRDNNLATMIVVCYLQQTCRSYLVSILQPVMSAIEPFVESCELDPTRLPPGRSVGTTSRNAYNLYCVCRAVLDAVFSAGKHAPAEMRGLCTFIRRRTEAAWDLPELRPDTPITQTPATPATAAAAQASAPRTRPAAFILSPARAGFASPPPALGHGPQQKQQQAPPPPLLRSQPRVPGEQPMLELHDWENNLKSTVQVDIMNDIRTALDSWLAKPYSAALDPPPDMFALPPPRAQASRSRDEEYAHEARQSINMIMAATLGAADNLDMTLSIRGGDKRAKARETRRLSQIKDTWRQSQSPRGQASPAGAVRRDKHASRRMSGSYFTPTETVISMLIFVRFFIPILTSPEAYGLVDARMSPSSRRGLLLCAKVLAVLCNGVSFGSKETYLMPMNGLIREYRPKLRKFLYAISSDADPQSAAHGDHESDDGDDSTDESDASDSVTFDELASQFRAVSVGAKIGTKEEQRRSRMSFTCAIPTAGHVDVPPVPPLPDVPPDTPPAASRPRHRRQASKQSVKSPAAAAAVSASQPARKTFDLPTRQALPPSPRLSPPVAVSSTDTDQLHDSEIVDESLVTVDFLSCLEGNFGKLESVVGSQSDNARLLAVVQELKPIAQYAKHLASSGRTHDTALAATQDPPQRTARPAQARSTHRLSDEYEDLGRRRGAAAPKGHAAR